MKILVSNDDGINAEGIRILAQELSKIAEVSVVAPLSEKSGTSHCLTTTIPLRAKPKVLPGITQKAWSVDGTPADCVKLALDVLLADDKPDIVISGINHGPNLGTDMIYSGTVAAALEGYLNGYPAIAVSAAGIRHNDGNGNYQAAAELVSKLCLQMQTDNYQPRMFLNVNVPGKEPADIKGVKYTYMGWRWYTEPFGKRTDPRGQEYYWLQGKFDDSKCGEGSDVEACNNGYATITPLQSDWTNHSLLRELQEKNINFDVGF